MTLCGVKYCPKLVPNAADGLAMNADGLPDLGVAAAVNARPAATPAPDRWSAGSDGYGEVICPAAWWPPNGAERQPV
jgi:hypothetical protein